MAASSNQLVQKLLNYRNVTSRGCARSAAEQRSSCQTTCCEADAGETIRRRLLAECDLHTILRLPTGIVDDTVIRR